MPTDSANTSNKKYNLFKHKTTANILVISDFEKAEINAVRTIFPNADVKCCMFHYGQSLMRNFKRLGLVPMYSEKNVRGSAVRNSFRY